MDPEKRHRTDLLNALETRGRELPFFRAMSLLERVTQGAAKVGLDGPVRDEKVRFRHDPSLGFSAGDIKSVTKVDVPAVGFQEPREVVEVVTTFLGLSGMASPLPVHLPELVLREDGEKPVRRDFLDIFHHRAISLLYRGVARLSIPENHEARDRSSWVKRALCLGGVDAYDALFAEKLDVSTVMQMLPLLVGRARGARGLRTALSCVLAPVLDGEGQVTLKDNVEGWAEVAPEQQMRLGSGNCTLGHDTYVGSRSRERSGKFEIRVGPINEGAYRKFLPGGGQLTLVRETVELFTRNPVDYDIRLIVEGGAPFVLGSSEGALLGRTTFIGSRGKRREVVLRDAGKPEKPQSEESSKAAA